MTNQTVCKQHLSSSINFLYLIKQSFTNNHVAEGGVMEGVDVVIKGELNQRCKIISKRKKHEWDLQRNAHVFGVGATNWIKDCPVQEEKTNDTEVKSDDKATKKKIFFTMPHDVIDNDDILLTDTTRKFTETISLSSAVLAVAETLSSTDEIQDTGGSTSIYKNKSLGLREPYETMAGVAIGGAVSDGGEIETHLQMETTFGTVYYSNKCAANILAYSHIKDTAYACNQNKEDDVFRVQMTKDSPTYIFKRKLGIYVLTRTDKLKCESVHLTTVNDNKKQYTNEEVKQADKAREFISRMGYPSTAVAIAMVNNGNIINCDINSSDIMRAEEIYGPPLACLKGKTL